MSSLNLVGNNNISNIKQNQKIGLYVGSFDPFHYGHLEIIEICLQYKYVDNIFIIANNPNKNKPNRSKLINRINIIYLMTKDSQYSDHIFIPTNFVDDLITMFKDYPTIGIMGSDQYLHLVNNNKSTKLSVNKWLIIPRDNYCINTVINSIFQILDKSLFKHQSYSSTMIRENIGVDNKYLPLNISSFNYIIDNKMWVIENKIKLLVNSANLSVTEIKNNVLLVNNTYIVKIFNIKQEYENEINSYQLITSIGLPIKTAKLITSSKVVIYYLIIYEYMGSDLIKTLTQVDSYQVGSEIGKSLSKLHNYQKVLISPNELINHPKINKLAISIDQIKDQCKCCFVHGDMSLLNIIYNNEIIMIDIGGIYKNVRYIKDELRPFGLAEYEYYQFISSVNWLIKDTEIANQLINGFKDGYGITNFNIYLEEVCKNYWFTFLYKKQLSQ